MRQWINVICILISVTVNIIPRWITHIASYDFGDKFFCRMRALSFVIIAIGACSRNNNRYVIILWQWVVGLAFNNYYDEQWGDPYTVGWVELTIVILIILWNIMRSLKQDL